MPSALMFPGQGAQFVGMAADLVEAHSIAREVFDRAEAACGLPLRKLCFEGPIEDLSQTVNSQPCIVTASIAALQVARASGLAAPDAVLGLSLGEYSALYAAGVLSLESAVALVHLRGCAMQKAATASPGAMASVMGADEASVNGIVERVAQAGVITVANYNCPGQYVLSGSVEAIDAASEAARALPRVRVIRLNVSGAFHSPLMAAAATELAQAIKRFDWHEPRVPVVQNVNFTPETNLDHIRHNLVAQLTGSVQFERSIRALAGQGIARFYEIGPGRVLSGLLKRIDPALTVSSHGTCAELTALA
jgi:[acyl-carrier-protein] S-malonyltransferase